MKNPFSKIPYWQFLLGPTLGMYLGIAINCIVLAANHGQMPVQWPGGCGGWDVSEYDFIHVCMTHASHLKFLCDWISLGGYIASPGDMLIFLGSYFQTPAMFAWIILMVKKFYGVDKLA